MRPVYIGVSRTWFCELWVIFCFFHFFLKGFLRVFGFANFLLNKQLLGKIWMMFLGLFGLAANPRGVS